MSDLRLTFADELSQPQTIYVVLTRDKDGDMTAVAAFSSVSNAHAHADAQEDPNGYRIETCELNRKAGA